MPTCNIHGCDFYILETPLLITCIAMLNRVNRIRELHHNQANRISKSYTGQRPRPECNHEDYWVYEESEINFNFGCAMGCMFPIEEDHMQTARLLNNLKDAQMNEIRDIVEEFRQEQAMADLREPISFDYIHEYNPTEAWRLDSVTCTDTPVEELLDRLIDQTNNAFEIIREQIDCPIHYPPPEPLEFNNGEYPMDEQEDIDPGYGSGEDTSEDEEGYEIKIYGKEQQEIPIKTRRLRYDGEKYIYKEKYYEIKYE